MLVNKLERLVMQPRKSLKFFKIISYEICFSFLKQ